MFTTLIPENGTREHIITNRVENGIERWEVACGHSHFYVEEFPVDELNTYKGTVGEAEPEEKEFCGNCVKRVGYYGGVIFTLGGEEVE